MTDDKKEMVATIKLSLLRAIVDLNEETLAMAIKVPKSEEPSDDCVSRQAVLESLNCEIDGTIESYIDLSKYKREFQEFANMILNAQEKVIQALPPVTPTRKKGKWIKVTETEFGIGYKCSECGRFILTESIDGIKLKDYPYCHCGAEMESEE